MGVNKKNDNFKNAWDISYQNGDNDLRFPSEEIVRSFYKNIYSQLKMPQEGKLSILDFGCGAGRNTQIFDFNKCNIVGYDLSNVAIDLATARYPKSYFTTKMNEYMANKYHFALADSCLDSMPWLDAVSSLCDIYKTLHTNGFLLLSLLESDSKQINYDNKNDILVEDDFEQNTMQTYFDWVRVERLLLPLFEIISAYKVVHTSSNGDLLFSRWYISCQAN